MPHVQELCRVQICWLTAGDLCLKSKLGLNEFAERNVIARFHANGRSPFQDLDAGSLLGSLRSRTNSSLLEGGQSAENPPVEVLAPVTLFEFVPVEAGESWLASEMVELGPQAVFGKHLEELQDIGFYLTRQGRLVDRGAWGTLVSFHTLWIYTLMGKKDRCDAHREFAGYLDLDRLPLGLFAEKLPKQQRPNAAAARTRRLVSQN